MNTIPTKLFSFPSLAFGRLKMCRLSLLFCAVLITAGSAKAQTTTTNFFDDFQDETAATAPAINTSSIGGGDLADVGTSWSVSSGVPVVNVFASRANALALGLLPNTATANFSAITLADGSATVNLDAYADYTSAGATTASIWGYSGVTPLFHLVISRGNSVAGGVRLQNDVGGTIADISGAVIGKASVWTNITVTLGISGYTVKIGTGTASALVGYYSGTPPATIDSIKFANDTSANSSRVFYIDNVSVAQTVGAPVNDLQWAVGDGTWDTGTANWQPLGGGSATTFANGKNVSFNDAATGTSPITVTLDAARNPGAVTVNNSSKAYILTGSPIAGTTNKLTKVGTSTVTLANANSYDGGTIITAGRVQVGNAGALGTGTVDMAGGALSSDGATARTITNAVIFSATSSLGDTGNNGALTLSGPVDLVSATRVVTINSAATFSGTVAGGMERKTGPGTLTFLGVVATNGVIGNWQIEDGNVVVNGGNMNKTQGGIRVNSRVASGLSRFQIINGASLTNDANIRIGSAGGEVTATNIMDIAATLVVDGSAQMGDACALAQLNLNAGGLLRVNGFADQAVGFTEVNFNGGTLLPNASSTTFMEGLSNVVIHAAGAIIDTAGSDITIGQALLNGGGGIIKNGLGTLTLTGASTYAGTTVVSNGTLLVSGSIASAATVKSGATLGGGSGTIAGAVTVESGGTLAPGASIGTLTIGGAATLDGAVVAEITGGPSADKLVFNGSAALSGPLTVTNIGVLAVSETYDLFDFSAAPGGAFSSVSLPGGLAHWNTADLYVGGTITLDNNTSPVAPSFTISVNQGESVTYTFAGSKHPISDPDGDSVSVSAVGSASQGTTSKTAGSVTYTSTGTTGNDSFTYTVADPLGATTQGTVTVMVLPAGNGANIITLSGTVPNITVDFAGLPSSTYAIERAANPTGPWSEIAASVQTGGNGLGSYLDTAAPSPSGYYRTRYVSTP